MRDRRARDRPAGDKRARVSGGSMGLQRDAPRQSGALNAYAYTRPSGCRGDEAARHSTTINPLRRLPYRM